MKTNMMRAAWTEIDVERLHKNFNQLKALAGDSAICACVKADAYGHGYREIALQLSRSGVDYLAVATLEEARALRMGGIDTDIVLLGPTPRGFVLDAYEMNLITVITTVEDAALLNKYVLYSNNRHKLGKARVFIAIETGMGRLGFQNNEKGLSDIENINNMENIDIFAIFSHLSVADSIKGEDVEFTHNQLNAFNNFFERLEIRGIHGMKRTLANSAGLIYYPDTRMDIVRPGIALYGEYPSVEVDKAKIELLPIMSVKSYITYVRQVPAGYTVSYGHNFVTKRPSVIGTLPLGYADGLPRYFNSNLKVLVNGQFAPIVGNICMDQCMVDFTDIVASDGGMVREYEDEVVIMGESGSHVITAVDIASATNTINYEVLTRFSQRLPRIYVY